jgi:uncharacterized membrane protein YfcA
MTELLTALIALLAFFVQGFTGFGASLILTPLLTLLIDLKTAVVASAIIQIPVGIWLTRQVYHQIDRQALFRLLPASLIGLVIGTTALATIDVEWLRRIVGLLTAFFALRVLIRAIYGARAQPWPGWVGAIAGFAGGTLGGLFGTSGPPVIAYLEGIIERGAVLRATLLAYFLILNSLRVGGYGISGMFTQPVGVSALAIIPGAVLGAWLGASLHQRSAEKGLRYAVAAVLFITGLVLFLRG